MLYISVKDAYDYQGRSYLHIPQDIGINLKTDEPPERCFLPKRHIHTWQVNIMYSIERKGIARSWKTFGRVGS